MKALVIYDSVYGNTEKVGRAVASSLGSEKDVTVGRVKEIPAEKMKGIDLLIVGSPVQGGRPTPAIQEFLNNIPANALNNVGVTAFDTRFLAKERGVGLRILLGVIGYAAGRIADGLKGKGGYLVAPPEGFIVQGKEGPLKDGELERAANWAKQIATALKTKKNGAA